MFRELAQPSGSLSLTAASGRRRQPSFHCWLLCPVQFHSSILAPSAVDPPVTSRQSPDCAPVIVPFALRVHCWLAPPLQSQICTGVPAAVWLPVASRHFVPP